MLNEIIQVITENLNNSSSIPNFDEMFNILINKEVNANLEEAREIFQCEFSQNISEEMEEGQIDELYQNAVEITMKQFKINLDPYLNVGEEIDHLFNEFLEIFKETKQNCNKFVENLDYSESMEGSKFSENNYGEEKVKPRPSEEEFNINLLNSEFDQAPKISQSSMQNSESKSIEKSFNSNTNFDMFATMEKLKKELIEKDEKLKKLELKSLASPASDSTQKDFSIHKNLGSPLFSPSDKESKILRQQVAHLENELSKKTALFNEECLFWSSKSEKDKNLIESLKNEIHKEKENNQIFMREKLSYFENERIKIQNKLEEANDKVLELENSLQKKRRDVEKEVALRENNKQDYNIEMKKKKARILELEENLRYFTLSY